MIETTFTPWASLGGGVLIGVASMLLMFLAGRVTDATGARRSDRRLRCNLGLGRHLGPWRPRTGAPGAAARFGAGWGIACFCPGGALPALGTGRWKVFAFAAALIASIFLARFLQSIAAGTNRATA